MTGYYQEQLVHPTLSWAYSKQQSGLSKVALGMIH